MMGISLLIAHGGMSHPREEYETPSGFDRYGEHVPDGKKDGGVANREQINFIFTHS